MLPEDASKALYISAQRDTEIDVIRPLFNIAQDSHLNYTLCHVLPQRMALNYFKPFLDTSDDEPAWLKDYELFVEELLINFGLYNALVDAEAELDALIMKDNHKVTRFFIDFFQLSTLCNYNNRALLQKVYVSSIEYLHMALEAM